MNFNVIAQNHLALNGNFDDFDFSMFTNMGIPKSDYKNFCYYAAGFHGFPELKIVPEDHFRLMKAALRGDTSDLEKVNWGGAPEYKVLGIPKQDFGAYAPLTYQTATQNKVSALLHNCLMSPDFRPITVTFNDKEAKDLTIFRYIALQMENKKKVTVQELMDLNMISLYRTNHTTQSFLIVPTIYSPITNADFNKILSDIYAKALKLCSADFIKYYLYFPMNAINFSLGQSSAKHLRAFKMQMVRAGAVGMTLNEMMHLFDMNIPDALYSFSKFSVISVKNYDGSYVFLNGDSAVTCNNALSFLESCTGTDVTIDVDVEEFKSAWQVSKSGEEPRRINID